MKKIGMTLAIILFIATSALALTQDQAVSVVREVLSDAGYECLVSLKDHDKNGIPDFGIVYVSGNSSQTVAHLLGSIGGAVGVVTKDSSWKSDKILVVMGEDTGWVATTAGMRRCLRLQESKKSSEIVGACLMSEWTKVEY